MAGSLTGFRLDCLIPGLAWIWLRISVGFAFWLAFSKNLFGLDWIWVRFRLDFGWIWLGFYGASYEVLGGPRRSSEVLGSPTKS